MNSKHTTIAFISSVLLLSSTAIFAADSLEAGTPQTTAPAATAPVAKTPATPAPVAKAPAPAAKIDSAKKPLAKVTCEEFLAFDEVIQPKYVIAAEAYTKGGKPKNVVIDVLATEKLVPVLIEECSKAPKESFFAKLKSKLKH